MAQYSRHSVSSTAAVSRGGDVFPPESSELNLSVDSVEQISVSRNGFQSRTLNRGAPMLSAPRVGTVPPTTLIGGGGSLYESKLEDNFASMNINTPAKERTNEISIPMENRTTYDPPSHKEAEDDFIDEVILSPGVSKTSFDNGISDMVRRVPTTEPPKKEPRVQTEEHPPSPAEGKRLEIIDVKDSFTAEQTEENEVEMDLPVAPYIDKEPTEAPAPTQQLENVSRPPVNHIEGEPVRPSPLTYQPEEFEPVPPDMSNMRAFLTSPLPKECGVLQCYIEREKGGVLSGMMMKFGYDAGQQFTLYTQHENKFLLAGKKRAANKTSNFLISMDSRDLSRESPAFLGKVRSNFVGTEFTIYNDGCNPEGAKSIVESGDIREELGVINYASNVLGSRGPRKMKVALPKVTDNKRAIFKPRKGEMKLVDIFRAGYTQDLFLMVNKPPKWNDAVGAYVLNFNGRVTMASVKNFQLVNPEDQERVVLQFGRVDKDLFSMDFQYPLSPLQAFSICLSSFDYKLACE